MTTPEVILDFARTYGIDPDLLFAFSCFEVIGMFGGLTIVLEVVVNLVLRFTKFIRSRIRSLTGKV